MIPLYIIEQIATKAHEGQQREDGKPYITHPCAVSKLVYSYKQKAVAWLHDVLEDCSFVTKDDLLQAGVPADVVECVELLTKKPNENYTEYLERVGRDEDATQVKIADVLHNLSDTRAFGSRTFKERRFFKYIGALKYLIFRERD